MTYKLISVDNKNANKNLRLMERIRYRFSDPEGNKITTYVPVVGQETLYIYSLNNHIVYLFIK